MSETNKSLYSREDTRKFLRDRVARPGGSGIAAFNSEGKVLLVKAFYKDYWSFPGGWIESGQTPLDAAILELEEETGLTVKRESLNLSFMLNRHSEIMQSYQFIFKTSTVITKDMLSDIKLQDDEITDFKFVSREEILENLDDYSVTVGIWAKDEGRSYYELDVPA